MNDSFQQRVMAIDWPSFCTSYGPAIQVPSQLLRLGSVDQKDAMAASHEIWCGLCHQHAYVSSAALPALPFLLEVLDGANEQLTVEILDILLGFVVCTNPQILEDMPLWMMRLRTEVCNDAPRLRRLLAHPNKDVADFASHILDELTIETSG